MDRISSLVTMCTASLHTKCGTRVQHLFWSPCWIELKLALLISWMFSLSHQGGMLTELDVASSMDKRPASRVPIA